MAASRSGRTPPRTARPTKAARPWQAVIWVLIALALFGLEVLTLSFVAFYPALGALAAALTAVLGGNVGIQVIVFAVVTVGVAAAHAQTTPADDEAHAVTCRPMPRTSSAAVPSW